LIADLAVARSIEDRGARLPTSAASWRPAESESAASKTRLESAPAAAALPSPWQPGTAFSKYEIGSRLAAGGMAEVWRAKIKGAQGFEKRIVIKTMHTNLQSRPELVQMFISEAAVAAQLSHPNIVHVFDFGQLEGRYFIAMEYIPGVTLRLAHKRMVARGERLPITTVLHVMMDVCDALEEVHTLADARGPLQLVHRDISPDNIIISTSGNAKLIDFGAARAAARTPPTSVFVGKYRYAAPERILRVSEDRRSDLYSAGVLLYECLAGKRPFDGTDAEVIKGALASRACDPRARLPTVPSRVAEVVIKATAHDPAERYPSARELRAALAACLAELGGGSKERDVTTALAALLEAPARLEPPAALAADAGAEAVPEPIGVAGPDGGSGDRISSGAELALCEVEILEASGPIRKLAEPPPLPTPANVGSPAKPVAPRLPPAVPRLPPTVGVPASASIFSAPAAPSGTAVHGWRRTAPARSPEAERSARERAVELFDRGLESRGEGRYGEALDAWEKALALAPDNHVYQANVQRLRGELSRVRAEAPVIDVLSALRVIRPSLGADAGAGLYRLLRLAAFDTMSGAEAIAGARAAGEKIGRSLGLGTLDELLALCQSLKLGIVEASVAERSTVDVVVRECVACAGAHESGEAMCHFESGLVAGAVAAIFKRPVRVRETTCQGGCGDDACRFEITFT
jgi:predicted hydrocarbon binding protein/tRNA A-37 threonylcarbamoyl transferase component Bud32